MSAEAPGGPTPPVSPDGASQPGSNGAGLGRADASVSMPPVVSGPIEGNGAGGIGGLPTPPAETGTDVAAGDDMTLPIPDLPGTMALPRTDVVARTKGGRAPGWAPWDRGQSAVARSDTEIQAELARLDAAQTKRLGELDRERQDIRRERLRIAQDAIEVRVHGTREAQNLAAEGTPLRAVIEELQLAMVPEGRGRIEVYANRDHSATVVVARGGTYTVDARGVVAVTGTEDTVFKVINYRQGERPGTITLNGEGRDGRPVPQTNINPADSAGILASVREIHGRRVDVRVDQSLGGADVIRVGGGVTVFSDGPFTPSADDMRDYQSRVLDAYASSFRGGTPRAELWTGDPHDLPLSGSLEPLHTETGSAEPVIDREALRRLSGGGNIENATEAFYVLGGTNDGSLTRLVDGLRPDSATVSQLEPDAIGRARDQLRATIRQMLGRDLTSERDRDALRVIEAEFYPQNGLERAKSLRTRVSSFGEKKPDERTENARDGLIRDVQALQLRGDLDTATAEMTIALLKGLSIETPTYPAILNPKVASEFTALVSTPAEGAAGHLASVAEILGYLEAHADVADQLLDLVPGLLQRLQRGSSQATQ